MRITAATIKAILIILLTIVTSLPAGRQAHLHKYYTKKEAN